MLQELFEKILKRLIIIIIIVIIIAFITGALIF